LQARYTKTILILLAALFVWLSSKPVLASEPSYETIHMKGTIKYIMSDRTYGILGENGKKYQPTRLDKEYRHDGMAVAFDAKVRKDLVGVRMWGTAVELTSIMSLEKYVSNAENEAIRLLLLRMNAFETRDLAQLQKIDVISRNLSEQEFGDWLGFYGKFTLRYVEVTEAEPATIRGMCLYTRELVNAMALSGNVKRTLLCFTLSKLDGDWKFTGTETFRPSDTAFDLDQYAAELEAQGIRKYGTDNLAQRKLKN